MKTRKLVSEFLHNFYPKVGDTKEEVAILESKGFDCKLAMVK